MATIIFAVLALALGIWIGLGAPGWPHKDSGGKRRHLRKRPVNPISFGRQTHERGSHRASDSGLFSRR